MKLNRTTSNFYPRSPCGERRKITITVDEGTLISIHALLAESDGGSGVGNWPRVIFLSTLSLRRATPDVSINLAFKINFYPRSPCGERPTDMRQRLIEFRFLSTLSLRRATTIHPRSCNAKPNFYPRSPCGERRGSGVGNWPRVIFLSTLSLRRATYGP